MKSISYEEAAAFGDPVALGKRNHDFSIQETTPSKTTTAVIQLAWNNIKQVQFTKCDLSELNSESQKYIVAIFRIRPKDKERLNFDQRASALKNRLNPSL